MKTLKWMICINSTPTIKEGEKYLVECRGTRAKVVQDNYNPHRTYGNIVNMNRFKTLTENIKEYYNGR
ncbi:MAG: hypothetical protein WD512_13640 [Candidatus Paceibacterota bacterium]